jgi:hypothetical protein
MEEQIIEVEFDEELTVEEEQTEFNEDSIEELIDTESCEIDED